MATTDTLDLSSLTDDGDTLDLPDGRTLRLRIVPDDESGFDYINGMDCMGRVAWCEVDPWTGYTRPRPEWATGRARKLSTSRGDSYWWEPAAYRGGAEDVAGWTAEDWEHQAQAVRDMVEYGPCGLVLDLLETCSHGCAHVVETTSLWGIEPFPDPEYVRYEVAALAAELGIA